MNKEEDQPEGCALVDKEVAGADVPNGGERGVLHELLLQRVEHCLLPLCDLLHVVSQSVSICTKVFYQKMLNV